MANTFLTTSLVAREALLLLRNNLVATRLFDRRYESNFTGQEKIGDTVSIRRRDEGTVQEFSTTISTPDNVETNTQLVLEKHFDASFEVTTKDLTLEIQDFSEQLLAPRMIRLAESVDTYCLSKLQHLPNVGTVDAFTGATGDVPAALPNTFALLAQVRKTMNILRIPMQDRVQVVSPEYEAILLGVDNFVTADKRADGGSALEEAAIGRVMGFDYFMGQNVDDSVLTSGTFNLGAIDVDHPAGVTSLLIDGLTGATDTLKIGDLLNIAGYGNVVVAADATGSTSIITVTIVEPTKRVLANNAVVSKFGGSAETFARHGAAFNPRAFAFAAVPMVIPPEADGAVVSFDGMAIRAIRDYNISTKTSVMSLDVLVGARMVDGELGVQVIA
jgi:hypothetical protein